jgi:hypothetical protein
MRLALYKFIYEVGGLSAPPMRNILLLYLHLLAQNVVANLLAVLTLIGSLAKHALVRNHTHRKVVYCHAVVLAAHYFGGHIARSA